MQTGLKGPKGILLAGGIASRLRPVSTVTSKQLLPVFDKPAIYYPLTTLMLAGIREILVISSARDLQTISQLLGDGSQWGIQIHFKVQAAPNGLPEAFIIAEEFLDGASSVLILGDNLFHGPGLGRQLATMPLSAGANIFAYRVNNPEDFGVVEIGENGEIIAISEKPQNSKSNFAIPGFYAFDGTAPARSKMLSPSSRGEIEITDLLQSYLGEGQLSVRVLPRGTAWLDLGTPDSLLEAAGYVKTLQNRQGILIGSTEEAAWNLGLISDSELASLSNRMLPSKYGFLLGQLLTSQGMESK